MSSFASSATSCGARKHAWTKRQNKVNTMASFASSAIKGGARKPPGPIGTGHWEYRTFCPAVGLASVAGHCWSRQFVFVFTGQAGLTFSSSVYMAIVNTDFGPGGFSVFSDFYDQHSVAEPGPTPSPWSIRLSFFSHSTSIAFHLPTEIKFALIFWHN